MGYTQLAMVVEVQQVKLKGLGGHLNCWLEPEVVSAIFETRQVKNRTRNPF